MNVSRVLMVYGLSFMLVQPCHLSADWGTAASTADTSYGTTDAQTSYMGGGVGTAMTGAVGALNMGITALNVGTSIASGQANAYTTVKDMVREAQLPAELSDAEKQALQQMQVQRESGVLAEKIQYRLTLVQEEKAQLAMKYPNLAQEMAVINQLQGAVDKSAAQVSVGLDPQIPVLQQEIVQLDAQIVNIRKKGLAIQKKLKKPKGKAGRKWKKPSPKQKKKLTKQFKQVKTQLAQAENRRRAKAEQLAALEKNHADKVASLTVETSEERAARVAFDITKLQWMALDLMMVRFQHEIQRAAAGQQFPLEDMEKIRKNALKEAAMQLKGRISETARAHILVGTGMFEGPADGSALVLDDHQYPFVVSGQYLGRSYKPLTQDAVNSRLFMGKTTTEINAELARYLENEKLVTYAFQTLAQAQLNPSMINALHYLELRLIQAGYLKSHSAVGPDRAKLMNFFTYFGKMMTPVALQSLPSDTGDYFSIQKLTNQQVPSFYLALGSVAEAPLALGSEILESVINGSYQVGGQTLPFAPISQKELTRLMPPQSILPSMYASHLSMKMQAQAANLSLVREARERLHAPGLYMGKTVLDFLLDRYLVATADGKIQDVQSIAPAVVGIMQYIASPEGIKRFAELKVGVITDDMKLDPKKVKSEDVMEGRVVLSEVDSSVAGHTNDDTVIATRRLSQEDYIKFVPYPQKQAADFESHFKAIASQVASNSEEFAKVKSRLQQSSQYKDMPGYQLIMDKTVYSIASGDMEAAMDGVMILARLARDMAVKGVRQLPELPPLPGVENIQFTPIMGPGFVSANVIAGPNGIPLDLSPKSIEPVIRGWYIARGMFQPINYATFIEMISVVMLAMPADLSLYMGQIQMLAKAKVDNPEKYQKVLENLANPQEAYRNGPATRLLIDLLAQAMHDGQSEKAQAITRFLAHVCLVLYKQGPDALKQQTMDAVYAKGAELGVKAAQTVVKNIPGALNTAGSVANTGVKKMSGLVTSLFGKKTAGKTEQQKEEMLKDIPAEVLSAELITFSPGYNFDAIPPLTAADKVKVMQGGEYAGISGFVPINPDTYEELSVERGAVIRSKDDILRELKELLHFAATTPLLPLEGLLSELKKPETLYTKSAAYYLFYRAVAYQKQGHTALADNILDFVADAMFSSLGEVWKKRFHDITQGVEHSLAGLFVLKTDATVPLVVRGELELYGYSLFGPVQQEDAALFGLQNAEPATFDELRLYMEKYADESTVQDREQAKKRLDSPYASYFKAGKPSMLPLLKDLLLYYASVGAESKGEMALFLTHILRQSGLVPEKVVVTEPEVVMDSSVSEAVVESILQPAGEAEVSTSTAVQLDGQSAIPPAPPEMVAANPVGSAIPPAPPEMVAANPVGSAIPPAPPEMVAANPIGSAIPPAPPEMVAANPVGSAIPPAPPLPPEMVAANSVGSAIPPAPPLPPFMAGAH